MDMTTPNPHKQPVFDWTAPLKLLVALTLVILPWVVILWGVHLILTTLS